MVRILQAFPHQPVVINLTIDSEGNALVRVGKWLGTTLYTYNAEALMSKY